ncbi:MAG: prolyl-tRNA synthetase [Thermomicrobiales bacterium]|jgi:prolyl-tRNA synthetase|nr:prolyl-tRNA synthetase [Thermomicrobiales bacterium]
MVHGDDAGLKLPSVVALVQVIVVPIWRTDGELATVKEAVARIMERLSAIARVRVDWRDDRTPGYNYHATQSRFIGPAPLLV